MSFPSGSGHDQDVSGVYYNSTAFEPNYTEIPIEQVELREVQTEPDYVVADSDNRPQAPEYVVPVSENRQPASEYMGPADKDRCIRSTPTVILLGISVLVIGVVLLLVMFGGEKRIFDMKVIEVQSTKE